MVLADPINCVCGVCRRGYLRWRRRGHMDLCKSCRITSKVREWRAANPERAKQSNTQPSLEAKRRYAQSEKGREAGRLKAARYAEQAKHARVGWADQALIDDLYQLAAIYRAAGVDAHVDHEIPLRGKTVCGLHVEHNLTVIPAQANRAKKNRFDPKDFQ